MCPVFYCTALKNFFIFLQNPLSALFKKLRFSVTIFPLCLKNRKLYDIIAQKRNNSAKTKIQKG